MSVNSNLNKFKRKGNGKRKRRNAMTKVEGDFDHYAIITDFSGSTRLLAKLLDGPVVSVRIPNKFYKKVWFRKDDIIIVTKLADTMFEIKGKVPDNELNLIKKDLVKEDPKMTKKDGVVIVFDEDADDVQQQRDIAAPSANKCSSEKDEESDEEDEEEINIDDI